MAGTRGSGRSVLCRLGMVTLLCCASLASAASAAVPKREIGEARILAVVPTPPGFPEGIAVRGSTVYIAGPATFGTTGKPPSSVVAFHTDTGAQVGYHAASGEDLLQEHANSSIAFDGAGRLYVLNTQLGIYRLDLGSGHHERYAEPFPDIPPCPLPLPVVLPERCSPTPADAPPIPNDIVFDGNGNAYVTDSTQATIWRIAPHLDGEGRRRPEVWFQHQDLASAYIGVNGIRLSPDRSHLFVTVSTDLLGRSRLYRLPVASERGLELVYEYVPGELPDGIAFGRSGLLYVAIANPRFSGVSVLSLSADGAAREVRRLANPPGSPAYPYDSPANIAFKGDGSVLLTNHAFVTGAAVPSQFSVLEVFVNDRGSPLERPVLP